MVGKKATERHSKASAGRQDDGYTTFNLFMLWQIKISKLFNWEYLSSYVNNKFAFANQLTIVFLVVFAASVFAYFYIARKKMPKFLKRYYHMLIYTGIYGSPYFLFLIFARIQGLNYLNLRSTFVISALIVLTWLICLLIYRIIIISSLIDQYKVYKRKEKYLYGKR